jgi:uncharacterized protein (TIGR02099 family)
VPDAADRLIPAAAIPTMTRRLLHALWLLLAVLLGLTAAALTAARLLVPLLGEYRQEAERLASAALHRPVTVERMEASWRGLNPVLKFKGIAIAGTGIRDGRLAIGQIWVGLDLLHYLIDRQVGLASIDVIGADVDVIRDGEGRIYIDRLQNEPGAAGTPVPLPAYLAGGRYSLHQANITFHDLKTGRPALRFSNVSLNLENSGGRHLINGNVTLPEQLGQGLEVHAEFIGPLETFNDWRGRLYVTGRSLSIMPDILKDVAPGIDAGGTADIRAWVDFGAGRLRSVTAEVELHNARLRHKGPDRTADYAAAQISGVFGWRRRENDWQFAARDVVVTRDGVRQAPARVTLSRRDVAGKSVIDADVSRLFLQDLKPLVQLFPGIEAAQRERFVRLHPEGLVESFTIRLEAPAEGAPRVLWFDVSVRDLALRPADGLPGIDGLTGTATGSQEDGTFWIDSQDFIYRDERLFIEPLHFDEFSGEGAWQYQAGRLTLKGDALHLMNGDLDAQTRLAFERQPDELAPRLDLEVTLTRFQLDAIRHYLPARIMPEKTVHWLERGLLGGTVSGGSVVLQGRVDQLPFRQGEGRLEARLPVRDAVLDFSPGWTPIRGLDAQVDFTGLSMDIRSRRGKIRSATLRAVHAQIKDLARPDLTLRGTVQGDLPVMLAELGSCPLGETYGGFVDRVESVGAAGLNLNLLVPLHHDDNELEVKGSIILKDNSLKVLPDGPALEHIKGQLAFTNHGISGNALKARLLDAPVNVDVATDAAAGVTRIDLNGPLDVASYLAGKWAGPAARIAGRSDWNVHLAVGRLHGRNEVPEVDLALDSDLQGITVDLPQPLGKTAQESRRLTIEIDRVSKPDKTLRVAYADLLQGVCALRESGGGVVCSRANIHLGAGKAVLPEAKLLSVSGRIPVFSLTGWQPVFEAAGTGPGLPVKLDLTIDELEVMQQAVRDVTLRSEASGLVRQFTLDGPGSAGTVELTRTGRGVEKITMNLERLFLEKHPLGGAAKTAAVRADGFPELQITIRKLSYNGVNYGELQLQAVHRANALHLDRLLLDSKKLKLEATGDWKTVDDGNLSQFDVEVKNGKLGTLLKELKYKEDISGGKLTATLHGSWKGAPWEFEPARVNGKLHVLVKDGQLRGVEPGAGRVLGLLSLHTLQRRLSLDFSDLFSKGFAFDRIEGNFVLDNGNAYTNDLVINGPAARIEISGRIGLAKNDYDELVTVIPNMTSSIPLAGAIAGGPAVGAALFVAQRLLGDELEKASSFTHKYYSVTGPWSDPVFTKIEAPAAESTSKNPAKPVEIPPVREAEKPPATAAEKTPAKAE